MSGFHLGRSTVHLVSSRGLSQRLKDASWRAVGRLGPSIVLDSKQLHYPELLLFILRSCGDHFGGHFSSSESHLPSSEPDLEGLQGAFVWS